jgi:methionyl-tRNA synthetase
MESFAVHKALHAAWEIINVANKIIDTSAPWILAKDPSKSDHLNNILYTLLESLRIFSILIAPVMPSTACKIQEVLGLDPQKNLNLEAARQWGILIPGTRTLNISPLFPRLDLKKTGHKNQKKIKKETMNETTEKQISIEDFQNIDLRVAKIIAAEKIDRSDKLIKLKIQSTDQRTIVSGIAEYFSPEELVGKEVIIVNNLKPVNIMGVQSEGMLLVAKDDKGLHLATVATPAESGARVR